MKVGVFSAILSDLSLEKALAHVAALGCETVELGTGAYPGNAHCNPAELLASEAKLGEFRAAVAASGLEISSLSCHGNPLHPDRAIADEHHAVFQATVRLAAKLGVEVVTTFSGCPGDGGQGAKHPNWVTCPWPPDFSRLLDYQWNDVAIPYWKEQTQFAADHGIRKIALEAHPGFLVYNPATMLRLRDAAGEGLGCNLDPSHFFWQGIDPVLAVRKLGAAGAIFHVHAKDTGLYKVNADLDGYLDTKPYSDEKNRAWIFRTVGYGHGAEFWTEFVSALRMAGYDGTLSMEHEDSLMSPAEGLRKGVEFLQGIVLREPKGRGDLGVTTMTAAGVKSFRRRGAFGALLLGVVLWFRFSLAAEVSTPVVTGEMSDRIGETDVKTMSALAQSLVESPLGRPISIQTFASSAKDKPAKLWRALVYFPPREASPQAWRGYSLACYWEASLYPQADGNRRKVIGDWSIPAGNTIGEYLVLPPEGGTKPARSTDPFAGRRYVELNSKLGTHEIIELIDTARGYSMVLKDGSELSFSDLALWRVYTSLDKDGQSVGTVDVLAPVGKLRSHAPFHVHAVRQEKGGWRITGVDQYVFY